MASWRFVWSFAGRSGVEEPGIDGVTWTERAAFFQGIDTQSRTATVRLPLPGLCSLVFEHGHAPETGIGRLFLGEVEVLAGRWTNVQFGADGEQVEITIGEDEDEDRASVPDDAVLAELSPDPEALEAYLADWKGYGGEARRVLAATWSAAQRRAVGRTGPYVIGAPGDEDFPGSPAFVVDEASPTKKLLVHYDRADVTGGLLWGPTAADSSAWGSDASVVVSQGTDAAGSPATVSDFGGGSSTVGYNPDGEYYWSWTQGGPTPRGAGDLCVLFLGASTVQWDVGAWASVRARLNTYKVDAYIDEPVGPLEWLRRVVWPMLPLAVVRGPRGLQPRLWPWLDEDTPGGPHLVAGPGFVRAGPVRWLRWTPEPTVHVRWGYDPEGRVYRYGRTFSARDTAYAAHAASIVGRGGGRPHDLRTWDEATAGAYAMQRIRMLALRPASIPFMADPESWGVEGRFPLEIGSPCTLTVPDLPGVEGMQAYVGEIERHGDRLRVGIYLRGDALKD